MNIGFNDVGALFGLKSQLLSLSLSTLIACAMSALGQSEVPDQATYLESFEQETSTTIDVSSARSTSGAAVNAAENLGLFDSGDDRVVLPDNALRSAREVSDETQDLRLTQQAVELVDQGDIEKALTLLTKYLVQAPNAHRSREALATILLAQGDRLAAKPVLDLGLSLAPNFAGFKKLMARLQMTTQPDIALDLLAQLPPRLIDDFEYHELYAVLLLKTGRFEESVARYRALLQLDSDNSKLWLAFAIALNATGAIDEALSAHQMAGRFGLSDPALDQYNRARLKTLRGAG